jgi:hypothetical protein
LTFMTFSPVKTGPHSLNRAHPPFAWQMARPARLRCDQLP